MNWFFDFVSNPFIITGASAWLFAQCVKAVIYSIVYKKVDFKRLFGDGGMPSGHSATVSSITVMCALVNGTSSFEFALSFFLAVIVCHDAMGVRRETGKQSVLLNEIIESGNVLDSDKVPEIDLKEFVGHTPLQVIIGVVLGVCTALVAYACFFNF